MYLHVTLYFYIADMGSFANHVPEEELAKRRLGKEREMLDGTGSVQVVTGKAIGPTMVIDVEVEDVLVSAVVDTGSQSTIISRPFLHKFKTHLESKGKTTPELLLPGTTFYGKSGRHSRSLLG